MCRHQRLSDHRKLLEISTIHAINVIPAISPRHRRQKGRLIPMPVPMIGARAKGVELKAWHRPAIRSIDHYILALGNNDDAQGKTRFLAALLLSTSDDVRVDELLQMVEDPTYSDHSLGHLAVACGFRAGEILRIVRDMELLVAQARGLKIIGDNLAAVVSDVVDRSQRHYVSCETCNETGKVWVKPKKLKRTDPDPEPYQADCGICSGRGKIVAEADPVRQQMVLEISKLLPKAGGSSIAIQQNLGIAGGGEGKVGGGGMGGSIGGLFDRIIGATDAILKRGPGHVEEAPAEGEEDLGGSEAPLDGEVVLESASNEPMEPPATAAGEGRADG